MEIAIPKPCQKALDLFQTHGFEAYLVGGCVRDSILGNTPLDWDICTNATPEETCHIFADYKVILTGLAHGTVTVLLDRMPLEITTYRIDGRYEDHRRPSEVHYTKCLRDDLSRRDFTINALAYHPDKGLIDYFGGLADLKNRLVRAVGDPSARFEEDGLRILRAVRFACVLNFDYDEATKTALVNKNHLLKHIAKERIQVEFNKILTSSYVAQGLADLLEMGLLADIMPALCHMAGFSQVGPHHFLDIFEHTSLACALIEPDLVLRLTMLLHDVGKPFVWCPCYDDCDCFPLHEQEGAVIAEKCLQNLRYDKKTQAEVIKLVAHHNDIITCDPLSMRRAMAAIGVDSVRRLMKVKVADILAHRISNRDEVRQVFAEMEKVLEQLVADDVCYRLDQLAISGQAVKELGYHGKEVGYVLSKLLEAVVEEPQHNTPETLLTMARHMALPALL